MLKALLSSTTIEAKQKYAQKCVDCGKEFSGFCTKCTECKGATEIFYDLNNFSIKKSSNPYIRYFDILPIKDKKNLMWLGEGNTPLIHSKKLGKMLGLKNLYLKFEGTGPTFTTKDRMATVSLSYLFEKNVKNFALASTGNTGTAYAHGIHKHPFFKMHLFYHGTPNRLNFALNENIKVYKVNGDFVKSCDVALNFAKQNNVIYEGGFFNPGRREGLKMAFVESVEKMPQSPDWYFQAVSSSMGVVGTYKAALELMQAGLLDKVPKLACIQQKSCNPMVRAWKEKSEAIKTHHIIENPKGLAQSILRGNPTNTYPIARKLVLESKGAMEDVTRNKIIEAVRLLKKHEGLECSYDSGVAFAGTIKMAKNETVQSDEFVLVNLTGGNRPKSVYPRQFINAEEFY